jgi:hypothetical protein
MEDEQVSVVEETADPMQFYYVKAELSDIEEKWLCSVCYWRYYSIKPILETVSELQFKGHCGECGV